MPHTLCRHLGRGCSGDANTGNGIDVPNVEFGPEVVKLGLRLSLPYGQRCPVEIFPFPDVVDDLNVVVRHIGSEQLIYHPRIYATVRDRWPFFVRAVEQLELRGRTGQHLAVLDELDADFITLADPPTNRLTEIENPDRTNHVLQRDS